ncbi:MAG: hypothetical protein GX792_01360 [Bacteroidales bacterium]|jgi:hypothetical protein|nr:hypothetical protein [Bacteroidales bacterium]
MRQLKKLAVFILFLFLSIWKGELAAETTINKVSQRSLPLFENVDEIPGDEGLAGVFAGVLLALLFSTVFPNRKEITGYFWKSRKMR